MSIIQKSPPLFISSSNTVKDNLALKIYNNNLDLGYETLEILKSQGLKPEHTLLDLGKIRFLTSCYLSMYLNKENYTILIETDREFEMMEECEKYVTLSMDKEIFISFIDESYIDFCKNPTLKNYDFILIQRNLAEMCSVEIYNLFSRLLTVVKYHKVVNTQENTVNTLENNTQEKSIKDHIMDIAKDILSNKEKLESGVILAHYVENFSENERGVKPILKFKKILEVAQTFGFSIQTLTYQSPINLRFLRITGPNIN